MAFTTTPYSRWWRSHSSSISESPQKKFEAHVPVRAADAAVHSSAHRDAVRCADTMPSLRRARALARAYLKSGGVVLASAKPRPREETLPRRRRPLLLLRVVC